MIRISSYLCLAWAGTFSGEATYLAQIETGCFDAVYINFNVANDCGRHKVLPAARAHGMGVFAREAVMKGALFEMGDEVGLTDRNRLAQVALKWVLSHEAVTLVVVGADDAAQLANSVSVLDVPALDDEERAILAALRETDAYRDYAARKRAQFGY